MAINNVHPVHAINRYLWDRIEKAEWIERVNNQDIARVGILSKSNYNGMIPIVPVEETADLISIIDSQPGVGSRPYMVYTFNRINTGQMWFMKTHQIAYSIRSTDDYKMGQLINIFEHEFERYDESARKVNAFMHGGPAALTKFSFKHISLQQISGPLPAESENGENEALVTITATFTEPH